jgi:small-conductance mechanosensitive channel
VTVAVALFQMTRALLLALIVANGLVTSLRGQEMVLSDPKLSGVAPSDQAVTLTYAHRPIVELRAHILSRMPAERAGAAVRVLDDLVSRDRASSPVSTREVGGALIIEVGGTSVIAILPADIDILSGETLEGTASTAASRLQTALAEAAELRAPGRLLWSVAQSVAITIVLFGLLWLLRRLGGIVARVLERTAERRLDRTWSGQAIRVTHLPRVLHGAATLLLYASAVVLTYLWFAFVLRRFPYTRPWGESLRGVLLAQVGSFGGAIVDNIPSLFTVVLILAMARWVSKGVTLLFDGVEHGRVSVPGVYPDTAAPTRRLVKALLWLSALAMAYPYIPGSESSGVKGISVFVGVIVSLGSTGVVQHLMAGLTLTFARAMRVGEFARIGDVEGTILQIGALATKVRTPLGEEITIPNSVVVSQTTTNYSRGAGSAAAFLTTSVTIGYDTPWRQVEALLLTAAQQTRGVCRTPPPIVRRVSLEDFYVKYSLLVVPEDPCQRPELLDQLHGRILDAFNEHDVQIMSPHYMTDPVNPKVVPQSGWYAAPASRTTSRAERVVADVP